MYSFFTVVQVLFYKFVPTVGLILLLAVVFFIYRLFTTKDVARAVSKKYLVISAVSLVLIVALWAAVGFLGSITAVGQGGRVPVPGVSSYESVGSSVSTGSFRDGYGRGGSYNTPSNGDITDTRDFTKKSFSAELKTREVEKVAKKVEVLIKGLEGRIDGSDISPSYASIRFVVPKDSLNDFEEQLRTYTHEKLYVQRVSSQNLLNEKKNLERNQDTTKSAITSLGEQQERVQSNYTSKSDALKSTVNNKNTQLKTTLASITAKQSQLNVATDSVIINSLSNQIAVLRQTSNSLMSEISNLSVEQNSLYASYSEEMSSLGGAVAAQNNQLEDLANQTEDFLNKVETAEGTITIRKISLIAMIYAISPVNLWVVLAGVLTIVIVWKVLVNKRKNETAPVVG